VDCIIEVAVTGKAPYKTLLTHGFVLDAQQRKMSKSLGNVIEPSFIIEGGPVRQRKQKIITRKQNTTI
jgi:isoleucyl-tRNA synthetase